MDGIVLIAVLSLSGDWPISARIVLKILKS